MKNLNDIVRDLNVDENVKRELEVYLENKFNTDNKIPETIEDEPFIGAWKRVIDYAKTNGIEKALNEKVPHGEDDIKLNSPQQVSIEIYNSVAGNIPVVYAKDENDFYELVTKIINKGKYNPNVKKTGASFAFGANNRFIILSNKPYSNVPAERLGLSDEQWRKFSATIRREHECTHYFTKRFLGSSQNNLHDELVADFAGIFCATGTFYTDWFLIGMGIEEYTGDIDKRRFPVYTTKLSEEAKRILRKIVIKAAKNVETWVQTESAKKLTRNEKIMFLCKNSLVDLYFLYE